MNVDGLRLAVRTQLDLDEEDLPNLLLDMFLQDGYDRIISLEVRWPFFETLWQVPVIGGAVSVELPANARMVESIFGPNGRILRIDSRACRGRFRFAAVRSRWHPAILDPDRQHDLSVARAGRANTTLRMRGFRAPTDWIAQGASAEVDADIRLHLPIVWYACAVGMAQQEDEVLEATYMNRFRESATIAHDDVMRPWTGGPKILNVGSASTGGTGAPRQPQVILNTPYEVPFDGTVIGAHPDARGASPQPHGRRL